MLRLLSRLLNALTFGNPNETFSARMARQRAACPFCGWVCSVLDFLEPNHCEMEIMNMKTPRKPGPLKAGDAQYWKEFQKSWGLKVDGKPGHQTTGQIVIVMDALKREANSFPAMALFLVFAVGAVAGSLVTSAF